MKPTDFIVLVVLAALWGGSFLFMRIASPAIGPLLLADVRVLIAGGALLVYAATFGQVPPFRARWKGYFVMGALNAALPFSLISAAELHLTAGLAAILNATTPLFAAIVSAVWLNEELTVRKMVGVLLGLAGVGVLVGWGPLELEPLVVLSAGASLLAAVLYAFAGVYARINFIGEPPLALSIWQQMAAGILLFPMALPATAIAHPNLYLTVEVGVSVIALALLSTSLAFLLYFRLIARVGPTKTLSATFLVPVFAVLWGVLLLRETVHAGTLLGMGTILLAVFLVTEVRQRGAHYVKHQSNANHSSIT